MFSNSSHYSNTTTTATNNNNNNNNSTSSYSHLSDHTQRTGSLVEYITMQHQKNENKMSYQATLHKSQMARKDPMRDAILKGQFLD
ncbi:unnamed protein product [Cunninghamella blakesleeana]